MAPLPTESLRNRLGGQILGRPISRGSERISASADATRQAGEINPSAEALVAGLGRLASLAHELHSRATGSTVSLRDGDLVGRELFAVSIYPELSVELVTVPTREDILAFVLGNLDLLLKQHHAFGSWLNHARNTHVLDVVVCVSDLQTASGLAQQFNQLSVFDLATRVEIAIENPRTRAEGDGSPELRKAEAIA